MHLPLLPLPPLPDTDCPPPLLVGFSGGLDSTVLLHRLAADRAQRQRGLRAVHVHHGLQADADAWARHCAHICDGWGVALVTERVSVDVASGDGLEAAARRARHAAFAHALAPHEWLVTAHHRDDQAETFLLRALRGAGTDGLGAMRPQRRFGAHQLWRPLLDTPRATLLAYAQHHGLSWIEDPSNASDVHDRNFLRQHVLPLLQQRWPHAAAALSRSAELAAQSAQLLAEQDNQDLALCRTGANALSIERLQRLSAPRRARVLRAFVAAAGAPPLPSNGVTVIEREVLPSAHDRAAQFAWQHWSARRWRDELYLLGPDKVLNGRWQQPWDGAAPLPLPDGSELALVGAAAFDHPLCVRYRQGGERLQLPGRAHSHALKGLLQEAGVPPWERAHWPLLWDQAQLLAAGDRLIGAPLANWLSARQAQLQWRQARGTSGI